MESAIDYTSQFLELASLLQNIDSKLTDILFVLGFIFAFLAFKYVLSVWRDI